tara:strand:+ start:133 stop:501 length:369 start_codon:yes stop_codon:yes gene_type:complete
MKTQIEILRSKITKDIDLINRYVEKLSFKGALSAEKYNKKVSVLIGVIQVIDMHIDIDLEMPDTVCSCTTATVSDVFNLMVDGVSADDVSGHLTELYPDTVQRCGVCSLRLQELTTRIANIV